MDLMKMTTLKLTDTELLATKEKSDQITQKLEDVMTGLQRVLQNNKKVNTAELLLKFMAVRREHTAYTENVTPEGATRVLTMLADMSDYIASCLSEQ
jgi:hypothetical protein